MSYYGNIILESNNNFAESLDFYMEEVNMFSNIISLDESINIINESNISKFITEAFKRIKNAFKALIDKIKEWIGKIFKKNFKLKDKKVIQTEDSSKIEDSSNLHTTNRIYFVYNDKEYGPTANDLDNLLSDYISDEGINKLVELLTKFTLARSGDVDKLKEQFEDIKSNYKNTKDIIIREKLVENISQSEFDKLDKEFDACQNIFKDYMSDLAQVCKKSIKRIEELEAKCTNMNDSIVESKALISLEISVFSEQLSRCDFLYRYYSQMLTNYRRYGVNPFGEN